MAITDFMKSEISVEEFATALKVLKHFKSCESQEEWMHVLFIAWAKLEQLEEFLEHIVNDAPLKQDTIDYMELHP